MSQTIENRIVEMQFENKQFESGVQESLSTLDKLKKALKFDDASKNLEDFSKNINKNIDLSGVAKSVEDLNSKFSSSGIAGMEVMRRLTDFAIEAGKTIARALDAPFQQIRSGGWKRAMNIEDAKFQLKGLGVTWESVSKDIDYAVADTAYGLDVAAKACAQLSASSVKAGDDMKAALRGISGVAAMGNTDYENISRIFTKAAGNGRVMAQELNMISQYGLNARATLRDFINLINEGTDEEKLKKIPQEIQDYVKSISKGVKVTESDINDFVHDSKINFKTFSYAMDSAFGEHAKKANETFFGALSNIKAALSKIGAEFATPLIKSTIPIFNEIRIFLNDLRKGMGPVFTSFANLVSNTFGKAANKLKEFRLALVGEGGTSKALKNLMTAFNNIKIAVVKIAAAILGAYRSVFPESKKMSDSIMSITEGIAKLTEKLIISDGVMNGFAGIMRIVFTVLKAVGNIIKGILPIAGKILNIILKVTSGIVTLLGAIINLVSKLNIVQNVMEGIRKAGGLFAYAIEKIKDAFNYLRSILNDTSTVTGKVFTRLKDGALTVAYIVAGSLYLAFLKLKEIFSYFDTHDPLGSIVQGVKSLTAIVKNLPIFNAIISGTQKVFGIISLAISKVINLVKDFINNLKSGMSVAHAIGNTLSSVVVGTIGIIGSLTEKISSLFSIFKKDRIIEEEIVMPINGASDALVGVEKTLTKTEKSVNKTSSAFEKGKNAITNFASAIYNKVKDIRLGQILLLTFGSTITILAVNLVKLTQAFSKLTGSAARAVDGIGYFFRNFGQKRTSFTEGMIAIAIAIGTMTASLWALSKIPTKKLIEVAGVLEALLVTMGIFSLIGKNGVGPFASAMVSFSGGILLLVAALYALDQVNMDSIGKKLVTLATISGIVLTVAIILSKAAPKLSSAGLGILAFSGAVYVLAKALNIISHADLSNIKENWVELSAVIIAFAAFASLVSNVGMTAALGLIGFIGVLKLLSKRTDFIKENFKNIQNTFRTVADTLKGAVEYLYNGLKMAAKDMKENEMFAKLMAGSTAAVIVTLLGFILAVGNAGKGIKKAAVGFALILAAIAGVMYVMAKVSEMIKAINDPMAIKVATDILYSLLIFITALATIGTIRDKIKIEDGVNTLKDVRRLMTSLGFLLLAIGGLAAMVGTLSEDEFKRAEHMIIETEAIIGVIAIFCTLITAVASKVGKSEIAFGTFAGIVTLLGGLLGSIAVLMFMFSQVDWEKDKQQLIAVGIAFGSIVISIITIMGMLTLLTRQASKEGSGKAAIILGTFIGIIGSIAGVVYALNTQIKSKEDLIQAGLIAGGIMAFLVIITALVAILEKVSTKLLNTDNRREAFKKTFNTLLVMIGAVIAFGIGLYALKNVDAARMWGQVTAISFMLAAVTSLTLAIQYFAKNTKFSITKTSQKNLIWTLSMIGGFILAFAGMAGIFYGLRNIDAGRMWGQTTALITTLGALTGLAMAIIAFVDKVEPSWGSIGKAGAIFGGMVGLFTVLAAVFMIIDNFKSNGKTLIGKSQTIVLVMLELEILAATAGALGMFAGYIKPGELCLLGMVALFAALSAVFLIIDSLKIKGIMAKSQTIILVMLELEVLGAICMVLGALAPEIGLGELCLLGMVGLFWALSEVFTIIDGLKIKGIMKKSQTIILVMLELEVLGVVAGALGIISPLIGLGELALLGMVGLFKKLSEVFTVIDGLKIEGIMKKSQTIVLVMLELEVLGLLSIISTPALFSSAGLDAMIDVFAKLSQVFTIIDGLHIEGLFDKAQTIIKILLELEGLSFTSIFAIFASIGSDGLNAMVDIFAKLATVFNMMNGMQLEGMAEKAAILVQTIETLCGMGVEGWFNSIGLEDLAECLQELTDVVIELTGSASSFSTSVISMATSLSALITTGPMISTWMTSITTATTNIQTAFNNLSTSLSNSATNIIHIITNMIDNIIHTMDEGKTRIAAEAESIGAEVEKGMNKGMQPESWGAELVDKYAKGIRSNISAVKSAASDMIHSIWRYIHFTDPDEGDFRNGAVEKYGAEIPEKYANGISLNTDDPAKAASQMMSMIGNEMGAEKYINMAKNAGSNIGREFGQWVQNSVLAEIPGVQSALNTLNGLLAKRDNASGSGVLDKYQYQVRSNIHKNEREIARYKETIAKTNPHIKGGAEAIKNAQTNLDKLTKSVAADKEWLDSYTKTGQTAVETTNDFSDALTGVGESGKKAKGSTTEVKDEIADFYDSMEGAISLFEEFNKETELTSDQLLKNMHSQIDGMTEWANQIQKLAFMGIDQGLLQQLAEMGPQGYQYTNAFVHMTAEQLQEANNLYHQSLMLPGKVTSQIYGSYTVAGRSAASGFLQGMNKEDIKGAAVGFAHEVINQMNEALDIVSGYSQQSLESGKAVTTGVKDGIQDPTVNSRLSTAIGILTDAKIQGKFYDGLFKSNQMYTVGANITRGIADGIEDGEATGKAKKSVENLCGMIIQRAEQMFDEHSPSKVFQRIGGFLTEGLGIGITSKAQSAVSAMSTTSEDIINTMRETINMANQALMDDIDEPVITPILDLSQIEQGSRDLNNLISRNSALNARTSFTNLQNTQWGSQSALLNATMDDTDVVDAISSLSNDINTLKDAMTNIKMVLDTGTMVGAMTPQIDQQLGMRQVLAGRGI